MIEGVFGMNGSSGNDTPQVFVKGVPGFDDAMKSVQIFRSLERLPHDPEAVVHLSKLVPNAPWGSFSVAKIQDFKSLSSSNQEVCAALEMLQKLHGDQKSIIAISPPRAIPPRPTKTIVLEKFIAALPDLASISATAEDGLIKGAPVNLSWSGRWQSTTTAPISRNCPQEDIHLISPIGKITLHRAFWTTRSGDGSVSGTCLHTKLEAKRKESTHVYRTIVRVDPSDLNGLIFPYQLHLPNGEWSAAYLPITDTDGVFDCFFLKEQGWFVIETNRPGIDYESYRNSVSLLRQFLSYLIGLPLDGQTADLLLSEHAESVNEVYWYDGNSTRETIYRPIPSRWSEWVYAERTLQLQSKSHFFLDRQVISKTWANYRTQPEFSVAVDYILHFPTAPVEMRGALLSVALETLTHSISKSFRLKAASPFSKTVWRRVRNRLESEIDKHFKKTLIGRLRRLILQEAPEATTEQVRIIHRRLTSQLNNPSNADKLTLPFEHLGIRLSDNDKSAIYTRNKFLHEGRLIEAEARRLSETWRDVYMIEMRLFTLINQLLLRALNYSGPIINWGEMPLGGNSMAFSLIEGRQQH